MKIIKLITRYCRVCSTDTAATRSLFECRDEFNTCDRTSTYVQPKPTYTIARSLLVRLGYG